jgi:hypothetical protein
LNGLVAQNTGWTLEEATAISNGTAAGSAGGYIAGYGTIGGDTHAFLLTPAVPGDANLDGQVDINDLTIVLANYGKTGATWAAGDFIGDGTVDINDLTIVLAHYGQSLGTSAAGMAAVPEPSGAVLVAIGAVGLLACAWRKRRAAQVYDSESRGSAALTLPSRRGRGDATGRWRPARR